MKSFLIVAVASLASLVAVSFPMWGPSCCPSKPAYHDATVAGAAASYVEIRTGDGTGSGVVIRPRCILTAAHVVEGAEWVDVIRESSSGMTRTVTRGRVTHVDTHDDIATVCTRDDVGPVATVHYGPLVVGEACMYVGTPQGFHRSVTMSNINDPARTIADREYVVANGNGTYGSSGGPMFVRRGGRWLLVGVCSRFAFMPPHRSPVAFVDARVYSLYPTPCYTGDWK